MKKLLGRIRKQQDDWAKRNVRIKINTADSDNNDNDVNEITQQDRKYMSLKAVFKFNI